MPLPPHGWTIAVACALLVRAPALGAQAPDTLARDTVIPLEGVVVSTVRPTATTGGASAVVARPDSLHVVPAPTLEEVLRELPFVSVRENSRGQAEITIRGSESRQVAVLLEGIPLTLGWDHRTDPSVVPVTGAESITLIRGLHSVLYGPNVLGGVVEVGMFPPPPAATLAPRVQLRAGVDQWGGHSVSAVASRSVALVSGDLLMRGGAAYRDRPGVALPGSVADTLTADPDLRANSDVQHVDGFVAARYHHVGGAWAGLSASAFRAERGVPPELHVADPRLWRYPSESRLVAIVSGGTGERRTGWGSGDLEASVGLDLGATEIESFAGSAFEQVVGTESGDDRTVTVRLLGDHSAGPGTTLTGAFTYADVLHRERIDGAAAQEYRQRLWSGATEVSLAGVGGTRLSAGLALDGADTPESGDKPPLGTLWAWGGRLGVSALALDERVRLHAAVSRRARFPSLRELYSGALGRFEPNPDLQPEKLLGLEAGFTTERQRVGLQAVAFHHRLTDAVVRAAAGGGRFRRENRDQIRSTGVELLADWTTSGLELRGDLMLQHVEIIDPSVATGSRRPEHQPGLRLGAVAEVDLALQLRGILGASYTGPQYCVHPDLEREVRLGGSGRFDAGLQRAWSAGGTPLRATLALDNVTDAAAYDQCGLPQPGRTLRFAIEVG